MHRLVTASVRALLPIATALVLLGGALHDRGVPAAAAAAPDVAADTTRTTMDGVYSAAQALGGADVFAEQCRSCHTPTVHSGPAFRAKWYGRTLGELFGYLRREMPKNEPGSMSDDDYAKALAYLLRINGMPAGARPLQADSAALHRIRLDSTRSVPTSPSPTR
jgi:S-disulfanyl-L-cysteine oxidoreductase SoxD